MDYSESGLSAIEVLTDVAKSNEIIKNAIGFYVTRENSYRKGFDDNKLIETIDSLRNKINDNDCDEDTFIPNSALFNIISYAGETVAKKRGLEYESTPDLDLPLITESNAERALEAIINADSSLNTLVNDGYILGLNSFGNYTENMVIETIENTRMKASDEKLSESISGLNVIIGKNATSKLMLSAAENIAKERGLNLYEQPGG